MLPKSRWHHALGANKKSNARRPIIEDVEDQNEQVSVHLYSNIIIIVIVTIMSTIMAIRV